MNNKGKGRLQPVIKEILAIILLLIYLFPLGIIIINANKFYKDVLVNPVSLPTDWTLIFKNAITVITDKRNNFVGAFISSSIITIVSVVLIDLIGSMCGWAITRSKSKTSTIIYYLFIAAMIVPFQVIMYPLVSWYKVLSDTVTKPLLGFSMLRSYPGIILAYMGFGMPMAVFLISSYVKGIPHEIEEAAEIDGCSKAQTFFYVVLPMLRPILITESILQGIATWNDYLLPLLLLGKDNPLQTLPLTLKNMVSKYSVRWDLMLTSTLLIMLPVIIIFLIFQKYFIEGMTEGAVKS